MSTEFEPWPKIARLNREVIVTEKINGTNAAVLITPLVHVDHIEHQDGTIQFFDNDKRVAVVDDGEHMPMVVYAQSRTRFITPAQDNYGFAKWVQENAKGLVEVLGEGRHFGEWWGSGIQNGGGAAKGDRFFSLFNTSRWGDILFSTADATDVKGLRIVPRIWSGPYAKLDVPGMLEWLRVEGSFASPGHIEAEGIVIFHTASNEMFKVTLKGDEAPKGIAAHAKDEER